MDDLTEKELFREAIHRFSQPRYWPGLVYILAMALMIAIPLALYPTHPLAAILLAVPLFGLFQYYALIATHEAIHYGLCPNRALNDALGTVLAYAISFNYSEIKGAHLAHHRRLGHLNDPDYPFYIKRSDDERISLRSIVFRPLIAVFRLVVPDRRPAGDDTPRPSHEFRARKNLVSILLFQILILAALSWFCSPWLALGWVLALGSIPGMLMHIRLILEHSGLILEGYIPADKKRGARTHAHPPSWMGTAVFDCVRVILSPFSFNFHHEHHAMPSIPFYNLWRVNRWLCEAGYFEDKPENHTTSYLVTVRRHIRW